MRKVVFYNILLCFSLEKGIHGMDGAPLVSLEDAEASHAVVGRANPPLVRSPSHVILHARSPSEPAIPAITGADLRPYYNYDAYMKKNVEQMIEKEEECEHKQIFYNKANIALQWVAGIGAASTGVIGSAGAAGYINPTLANFLVTCAGTATGLALWGASQCKKSADEYYKVGFEINQKLGVSLDTVLPEVSVAFDRYTATARQTSTAQ